MAKRNSPFSLRRILIIVSGIIVIFYALQLYYVQRSKLLLYQREIEKLKEENATLEKTLKKAETTFMTEKIAREQMGMMKPGEYKILLKGNKNVSDKIR
ncbi:MAG: septum formation initiator family protein [Candidatus Omnitrophica bacterium]|nr:septum formation initiator family protein [Candidatus Omnitrophota bacterium]MCM8789069.1 septum formation initiator family protein [Candidatus Omnitrophota bacterium]